MTKQEFLDTLGKILRREMSDAEVTENIRYYDNYIVQEMRGGKTEAQVLAQLGDPRLIARTILQVDGQKENTAERESVFTEDGTGGYTHSYESGPEQKSRMKVHSFGGAKGWLILIAILLVLFVILRVAFALFVKLLPVVLIVVAVLWFRKKFFS